MNLSPEIISGLIGILGTAIIAFIGFQINTHRGNKVVLRIMRVNTIWNYSKAVNSKFSVSYDDKKIYALKLYDLEITNDGFMDIENLVVTLEVNPKEKTSIIDVLIDDDQYKTELINISNGEYYYLIKRPFLNMKKKTKDDRIRIYVYTDKELSFNISGGGKGWGVEYKEYRNNKAWLILLNITTYVTIVLSVLYGVQNEQYLGFAFLATMIFLFFNNLVANLIQITLDKRNEI